MIVKAGSTDVSVYYYIVQDASATSPGEPVTGLLFSDIETGGSASYMRQGGLRVGLTLITLAAVDSAHADGGFIEVDGVNMKGLYRCDYPDAAFATGVDQTFCQIVVAPANNAVAAPILVDIDDNVDQTGDSFNRIGPNGAGLTAINLPDQTMNITGNVSGSVGSVTGAVGSVTGAVGSVTAAVTVGTNNDKTAYSIAGTKTTLDALKDFDPATQAVANVGTVGSVSGAVGSVTGAVGSVSGSVGSVIAGVTVSTNSDKSGYSISGTLQTLDALKNFDPATQAVAIVTTVGSVTGAVGSVTGGVTVTTNGDKTGYSISGTKQTLDALNDITVNNIIRTALTEAYAADGVAPTMEQLLFLVMQNLQEFAIVGTTLTAKKLDGIAAAATYTLDSATNPTSRTRAT